MLLSLLLHGNQLKRTPRTGWVQRGIVGAENVAAHSYGVAYITLVLAPHVKGPVDMASALAMALLHDLPEGLTTDIPTPAWRYLPENIKTDVERGAMMQILDGAPASSTLMAYWEELHAQESAAARLVDDADKLDLYLQAFIYEEQTGNRQLAEFWAKRHQFYFEEAQAIYEEIRSRRAARSGKETA